MAWLVLAFHEPLRFLAPGAGALEARAPGRYVVWHEYRGAFENQVYAAEPGLPGGVRFRILAPDGTPLALEPAGTETWSEGDAQRRAVGRFEAPVAGRYSILAEGDFPPRIIAVGPDLLGRIFGALFGAAAALLLGVGGGIGVALYGVGRIAEKKRGEAVAVKPGSQPPAPDPQKQVLEMVTVVYALQSASFFVGVTLIGGVIIDYLQREEAAGTWLESHVRWQIRTFWWLLGWTLLGILTLVFLIGFAILFAAGIWFMYRVARGWIALRARRPVP